MLGFRIYFFRWLQHTVERTELSEEIVTDNKSQVTKPKFVKLFSYDEIEELI